MLIYIIAVVLEFVTLQNTEVKIFNDFDTFNLTPINTKDKKCLLKIECTYQSNRLTEIIFKTENDSVILNETVISINNVNYFVHTGKKTWRDVNGKQYIIKKLKFIQDNKVRFVYFKVIDNQYKIIEVSELRYDASYRPLSTNITSLSQTYSSINDFVERDINNLREVRITKEFVKFFSYENGCNVDEKARIVYTRSDGTTEVNGKSTVRSPSYGECLYLDCLRAQSYKD